MKDSLDHAIRLSIPPIRRFLVPHFQKAVENSVRSYLVDPVFNDKWTFSTNLWKNAWNRIVHASGAPESPIVLYGKGNEYRFRIGEVVLHHHRIDDSNQTPAAAKTVKAAARAKQLLLPSIELTPCQAYEDVVLAIDASFEYGLRSIFIGVMACDPVIRNRYHWERSHIVFTSQGAACINADGEDLVAEEVVTPPLIFKIVEEKKKKE